MSFTRQLIDFPFNNDNNCMQSSQDVDSTITNSNYEEEREREKTTHSIISFYDTSLMWNVFQASKLHAKCNS